MLSGLSSLTPPDLSIIQVLPQPDGVILVAKPRQRSSLCPHCGYRSGRVHSHYMRRLSDLPWQGNHVEIHFHARRLRCGNSQCPQQIFTERLPETVQPGARRTKRLRQSLLAIGFAVGGAPGARLSRRLAMPVSGDTLLRIVRTAEFEPSAPPRLVGIDDWAWRKGQRYGTIICDLERNRVIELLPDRNADTVASWLEHHPGIEIIARDRAGLYADGARRGAPDAIQVADRWHLLQNLGEALRLALGRHRKDVRAAGKAWIAEMEGGHAVTPQRPASTKRDEGRTAGRSQRHALYLEMLRLRQSGLSPRNIAPRVGMSVRTVERWLAAGGAPEHRRRASRHNLVDPFRDYLMQRWQEGERSGMQLWNEIRNLGFTGSRSTFYRWIAARNQRTTNVGMVAQLRPPSRRACAWLLSKEPTALDDRTQRFLSHLFKRAPPLLTASQLARRFAALIRGDDDTDLNQWIADATSTELDVLAKGIGRDIAAVRAAITHPWSTSPVEGRINRLKTLKRQMYGRAGYQLLRSRLLAAA